ncbi:hypothetical protein [Amycolatopsis sp. CA-230715]|uniref:hypothetical protein n=1 Tax=Amycolatopsis sp. CA-230715 TaxID=2745196 RepID=UPI001C018680|nr:hypothetical protein [Amycolatopsis sp. CA-230715]QWF85165.1 hypothetical protein HUW46_08619 [Amycolatopsis sp. CA-230715]
MTPSSTTTHPARFLLLGDSHAGPIGRAAKAARIPFHGGPLGAGREFNAEFFDASDADVAFRGADAERHYRDFLGELGITRLADLGVPLVSTFGFGVHFVATKENWTVYRGRDGAFPPGFLTSGLFDDIVVAHARGALRFYRHARSFGIRVLAVLPPQRVPPLSDAAVFQAAQDTLASALTGSGVEIVDLRARVTDESGAQRPELCETGDPIHGNLAFGRLLLDRGL